MSIPRTIADPGLYGSLFSNADTVWVRVWPLFLQLRNHHSGQEDAEDALLREDCCRQEPKLC